jgi:hypothetical protein
LLLLNFECEKLNEKRTIKIIAMTIESLNKKKKNAINELKKNAISILGTLKYAYRNSEKEGYLCIIKSIRNNEEMKNPNKKMKNPSKKSIHVK